MNNAKTSKNVVSDLRAPVKRNAFNAVKAKPGTAELYEVDESHSD